LEEGLLIDALDEALQDHRTAADSAQGSFGNFHVVLDQIQLCVAAGWKDQLVWVGDRYIPPHDL
jgi:hypothetical protein